MLFLFTLFYRNIQFIIHLTKRPASDWNDGWRLQWEQMASMGRVTAVPARVRKSLLRHGSGAIKVDAYPTERVHPEWKSRSDFSRLVKK